MKIRLDEAKKILAKKGVSCVVLPGDGDAWCSDAIGIQPLMIRLREDRRTFSGCVIADKVVGKAAALLTVLGQAEAVYGEVMSQGAVKVFKDRAMPFEYGTLVPCIENRTHTGRCPMEETVLHIEEPSEAFEALEVTIQALMRKKGKT